MATGIQISPPSDITIGTTAISNGTEGRVLFQGAGNVVQQDAGLFWDNTNKRLGVGATPNTSTRLDVRAQGTASTDIAFRVRNSADTFNIISINGDNTINYSNSSSAGSTIVHNYYGNTGSGAATLNFYTGTTLRSSIETNQGGAQFKISAAQFQVQTLNGFDGLTYSGGNLSISPNGTAPVSGERLSVRGTGNNQILVVNNTGLVDVRAQGALSTDIAFRVRNSADSFSNVDFRGNGDYNILRSSGVGLIGNSTYISMQQSSNTYLAMYPSGVVEINAQIAPLQINYQTAQIARFGVGGLVLGGANSPTTATNTLRLGNGVSPTTNFADHFWIYSSDIVAGNAAPHFRTEAGNIIKLYTETTAIGGAGYVDGVDDPIRKDTTINGYTLDQVVKALQNFGLLA